MLLGKPTTLGLCWGTWCIALPRTVKNHCDISCTGGGGGGQEGASGQPRACGGSSFTEILDISTNFNSTIFFTTFYDRNVAGLNGPLASRELAPKLGGLGGEASDAAAVSMSSPNVEGVKMGSLVTGLLTG